MHIEWEANTRAFLDVQVAFVIDEILDVQTSRFTDTNVNSVIGVDLIASHVSFHL